MKQLQQAIVSHNSNELNLYFNNVPSVPNYPFCVFYILSNQIDYHLGSSINEIEIQFTIWDNEVSSERINDEYEKLINKYDEAVLNVEGFDFLDMTRFVSNLQKDNDNDWQYSVRYIVRLQKK